MDARFKKVGVPLAVGAAGLLGGALLAVLGAGALGVWIVAGQRSLPLVNNNSRPAQYFSYGVFLTAVAGIPLALLGLAGGIVPVVFSGLRALKLKDMSDSPLLDQTGLQSNEAAELAALHNQNLAKRLGIESVPACR